MYGPRITVTGSLGADPELRSTQSGKTVASFRIANTPRNKVGDQYQDGETMWFSVSAWDELATNVMQSLKKGTRVSITGELQKRSYEKDGVTRESLEITNVDSIAVDLRFAPVAVGQRQQAAAPQPAYGAPQPAYGQPPQGYAPPAQQGYAAPPPQPGYGYAQPAPAYQHPTDEEAPF